MKTVTISQVEYDELLTQKAQIAGLTQQVQFLMEQLRLTRHRQFGVSSEKKRIRAAEPLQ